jgi:TolA-binding protein
MPETTWIASGKAEAPKKADKAFEWIKNNRETFIGSIVILVAAIIFSAYFFMHYRGLRDAAWKNLFMAQQMGYAGNIPQAMQQLDGITASYGSTSAAPYALMTKGDILFAQNKFQEAAAEYTKALNDKNVGPFASYNLGKCKEAAGDLAGAQAQYSDFLSKTPDHYLAPEVHASLARCQELSGATDLARTSYEKIALLYPDTSWAAQAKARLAQPAAPAKK